MLRDLNLIYFFYIIPTLYEAKSDTHLAWEKVHRRKHFMFNINISNMFHVRALYHTK
jgi:hypothetical protein